jgi:hypothetical protein
MITNFDNAAFLRTLPDPVTQKSTNGKLIFLFATAMMAGAAGLYFYSRMKKLEKELNNRAKL